MGFGFGEIEEAFADALVEGQGLGADGVTGFAPQMGGAGALETGVGWKVEEERKVGSQAAGGYCVEFSDEFRAEGAAVALVGDRGVREAIADDGLAAFEGGPDDFGDVLGAGGLEEEEFGERLDRRRIRVLEELPDVAAERGAGGFFGEGDGVAVFAETFGEFVGDRGFAGAVAAFEGDEEAGAFGHLP